MNNPSQLKRKDRIQCLVMSLDDPDPIAPMTKGTLVTDPVLVENAWTFQVRWDNGRRLGVVCPPDEVEKI